MTALYTSQINFLGARLLHGTYARDQIPSLEHERLPFALVINTDVAAGPGEHWLAFYAAHPRLKCLIRLAYLLIFTYLINLSFIILAVAFRHSTPLLFIYLRSRGCSYNKSVIILEKNFTDASAARKMLDLSLSKLSHVHCTGQSCKIKS